ncbi:MAG: DNA polymerase III subunit beta [bacterium]
MKFSASQSTLLSGFLPLSGVVPSKSPLPALGYILAELRGNSLTLAATDLEVTMENRIEVVGEKDGKALLPARRIMEIFRELPDISVSISVDKGNRISIQGDSGNYKLSGEDVEGYPQLPRLQKAEVFPMDRARLHRLISKTLFAVSRDELRPQLTGVLLQVQASEIRCISTDGHRLVQARALEIPYGGEPHDFIVPAKAMATVLRNSEGEGQMELQFEGTQLCFVFGEMKLTTRLIEGRYPNYEAVIPKSNENILKLELDAFRSAVRRVAIFSSEVSRQIRLQLAAESVEISAEDVESGGEARERVPCEYRGTPMDIGYNASYVLDVLKQVDTSEVVLELGTPTSAGLVKPTEQEKNEDLLMLIMPVRLN